MVEKIMLSEDEALLNEVKLLLGLSDHDFWSELSDPVKVSIRRGLAQSEQGDTIPQEKLWQKYGRASSLRDGGSY